MQKIPYALPVHGTTKASVNLYFVHNLEKCTPFLDSVRMYGEGGEEDRWREGELKSLALSSDMPHPPPPPPS